MALQTKKAALSAAFFCPAVTYLLEDGFAVVVCG